MISVQSIGRVAMAYKGVYNENITYNTLDVVSYAGGSYVAKKTTQGNSPTLNADDENWALIAAPGVGIPSINNGVLTWNGDGNSISISSVENKYGVSDNASVRPQNWENMPPSVIDGGYLWTQTIIHFNIGDAIFYTVSYQPVVFSNGTYEFEGDSNELPVFGFISSPANYVSLTILLPKEFQGNETISLDKNSFKPVIRTPQGILLGGFNDSSIAKSDFKLINYSFNTTKPFKNCLRVILKRQDGNTWYGSDATNPIPHVPVNGVVNMKFTVS